MSKPKSKSRSYSQEFKLEAVKLIIEKDFTYKEASLALNVPIATLSAWVKDFKTNAPSPGKGHLSYADQKIKDLEKKLKKATIQNEILKKAMAYFT